MARFDLWDTVTGEWIGFEWADNEWQAIEKLLAQRSDLCAEGVRAERR